MPECVRMMKERPSFGVLVKVAGLFVGVTESAGAFSMSESDVGEAWAELALDETEVFWWAALSAVLSCSMPPAIENGWFSQTRHVSVGK